ncbi:MAG: putative ABC transport system permease protein [Arenicella sp.]|jgi:putative ABC transport system permease protein
MNKLTQISILMKRLSRPTIGQKANRLLSLCIVVCTCVAASLGLFASSVQSALDNDIASYLGAPMVVRSEQPLPLELFALDGLTPPVITASFTTGAIANNAYQSVSLKGVSIGYPLQGELVIRTAAGQGNLSAASLAIGSVWLDQRVMDELNIQLGEKIQVGTTWLTVAGEVVHEPDRLTQLQHALPRAMVNLETLAQTAVSADNNRGEHRVLIAGKEAALMQLESQLASLVTQQYEVLKAGKGRHPFSRISLRAERMLNVILVLILLMCGGAAATLADHSVRHYAMPATVLRCMGVNRKAVAWALCLQLLLLALVMSLVGCLLGWLVQPLLINVMQPHMTLQVAELSFAGLLGPIGIGLVTVTAFVVPKLQQLGSISVTSVLRGQIEGPRGFSLSRYMTTLSAGVVVVGMLWFSSDNIQLTMMLVGAVVFLIILSIGFGWGLSKASAQAHRFFRGPIKVAVRSIGRSPGRHITPLASVSIAMMAVLMTVTLRGSFLDVLQVQMLDIDGNYIYTGLPAEQRDNFMRAIDSGRAELKGSYPTVSSRLVSINEIAIDDALKRESDTREETRSKVRLSWSEELPDNNRLLQGNWPTRGSNEVSVESEVMTDLGLQLGDKLGFQVGDALLISTITSRREYQGGGSRMMFWFMFSADALAPFEQHYMGGIMLNDDSLNVLSTISSNFPQVRIADLERQITGIRDIMIVLTRLMNTTLILLLAGALMVISASSFVSASNRQTQTALMRAIGLRRAQCYAMNITEQLVVGLVACLIGILGVQLIAGLMFDNLFALPYELEWGSALLLTALISATFAGLGWLFAFRQLQQPVKLS